MKIAFISTAPIPSRKANSIQIMRMCKAAKECNLDPLLIVPDYPIEKPMAEVDIWRFYGLAEEFPVLRVQYPRIFGSIIFSITAVFLTLRLKADYIWSRHLPVSFFAAIARKPVITEFHTLPDGRMTKYYLYYLSRSKWHIRSVLLTAGLQKAFQKAFPKFSAMKGVVIGPDGFDPEAFIKIGDQYEIRTRLGLPNDRIIAGYTGHFYPGKGSNLILDIAKECKGVEFILVGGEQNDIQRVKDLIKDGKLDNVKIKGFISPSDVPSYLFACDLLLLPNRSVSNQLKSVNFTEWTSPLKLFDYMAAGKAILASDLPVFHEILDEESAVFCNPYSTQAWVDAIRKLQVSPARRRSLGENAKRYSRKYTWKARITGVLDGIVPCNGESDD